jgi:hypothetical protein
MQTRMVGIINVPRKWHALTDVQIAAGSKSALDWKVLDAATMAQWKALRTPPADAAHGGFPGAEILQQQSQWLQIPTPKYVIIPTICLHAQSCMYTCSPLGNTSCTLCITRQP